MAFYVGKILRRDFSAGTKSERAAVILHSEGRDYIVRRAQGNPFQDPDLEKLVGKTVRANGLLVGEYTLLVSDWTELPSSNKTS